MCDAPIATKHIKSVWSSSFTMLRLLGRSIAIPVSKNNWTVRQLGSARTTDLVKVGAYLPRAYLLLGHVVFLEFIWGEGLPRCIPDTVPYHNSRRGNDW